MTEECDRFELRAFFATTASDGAYDATIDLVVPHYRLLHETICQLLRNQVGDAETPLLVVDIGSGTGRVTLDVLLNFVAAHVLAIDFCPEMQAALRTNFGHRVGPSAHFSTRCTALEADILDRAVGIDNLLASVPRDKRREPDAVISAFTIHHFDHAEKRDVYKRAFDLLRPGGVLINGDLFSYESEHMASQAQCFDLRWIRERFEHPPAECTEALRLPISRRRELATAWEEHYLHHNRLEPLHSDHMRGCEKGQTDVLASVGFVEIEVPYRFWQTGILWAQKPAR